MNELAELIKAHQDSGPEEAILHYLNAYQKNPNDELAYLIGICYGQIGQPKKSMEYFDKISQASYRVLNAKAGAAITSRDYNTAEELLTQSITLKPDNANAYAALARLFSSKREYTRAITHLQKAITIAPKVADYHYNLGLAYQNSYRIEDALTAFKTAVNYDVKHPAAWRGRGLCLEIKSDF